MAFSGIKPGGKGVSVGGIVGVDVCVGVFVDVAVALGVKVAVAVDVAESITIWAVSVNSVETVSMASATAVFISVVAVGTTVGSDSEKEHAERSNDNVNMKRRCFNEKFFIAARLYRFLIIRRLFSKILPATIETC